MSPGKAPPVDGWVASLVLALATVAFSAACDNNQTAAETKKASDDGGAAEESDFSITGSLTLTAPDRKDKIFPVSELARRFDTVRIESQDPNYDTNKTFIAIPLSSVLDAHFDHLEGARLLFTASDGYSVEVAAEVVDSPDAFLALGETTPGDFAPIGPRGVDAGPLYLVWRGSRYTDDKKYPRPWALSTIELLDSADRYTHTRPPSGFGGEDEARRGYQIFSASCIRCHAINREGGHLGPDLNVPQNVLAYRPEEQVRAYIKDPRTFRYSNMPAHEHMSDADLDALIAYLRVMGQHQYDPGDE